MNIESRVANSETDRPKLDALIVLGHNIGAGWKGERIRRVPDHLSGHSKLNALAAGILFKEGLAKNIIFSSGHTAGNETPSEAEAMRDFLITRFPEIPSSAIILEDKSIDTAGNAEESIRILNKQNYSSVGLMSTNDHLRNSIILFARYGLRVKKENSFASEEVIAGEMAKNPSRNPKLFIEGYRKSSQVKKDRQKEIIRSILLHTIDGKGMLLRQITKKTRK